MLIYAAWLNIQSNPPPQSQPNQLFQQKPKYWNQNLYMQNVLVDIGMQVLWGRELIEDYKTLS